MDLADRHVVVTGGAHGIGEALCRRFSRDGARAVVVADRDEAGAEVVARAIGGTAFALDVADPEQVSRLVARAREQHGEIDLFCSNAGISIAGGTEVPVAEWQRIWEINVLAHVHAAQALLPAWLERGEGYLLHTVSAAGLLSQIGSAPYSVTKHAALGLAEWLAITHGGHGIRVSALCPQAVRTAMTAGLDGGGVAGVDGMLDPDAVADEVVRGLAEECFWILPHPEVAEYVRRKAGDVDRWLRGMQKLQGRYAG